MEKEVNWKYNIGERIVDDKRDLTIINRKMVKTKKGIKQYYKYKCNICGFDCGKHYEKGEFKKELWISKDTLIKKCGCSCCFNKSVVTNINSIWKVSRWMCELGLSEYDAKRYSCCGGGNKVTVICPHCGTEKDIRLSIRISKDERDLIKEVAEEENRTVSNYVLNLVRADLEKKLKKRLKKDLTMYNQR